MQLSTLIQALVGLFWTATYVEIAYRGNRDRTYGMPIVALWFNLTWEFYWAFVERPPGQPLMSTTQIVVDVAWLAIDIFILISTVRFGPREFPTLRPWAFYGRFTMTAVLAATVEVILTRDFNHKLVVPVVFGGNLMASGLFIAMLLNRGSRRGQSMRIGVNKLIGSGLASIGVSFYAPPELFTDTALLPVLYVGVFVLDLVYLVLLWRTPVEVPQPGLGERVPVDQVAGTRQQGDR